VGVEGQYDIVRATSRTAPNVPRIPPQRLGGGVYWRTHWPWRELLHAYAQNDIAPHRDRRRRATTGSSRDQLQQISADNFPARDQCRHLATTCSTTTSETSVSYNKDEVLLPGLGVRGVRQRKFLIIPARRRRRQKTGATPLCPEKTSEPFFRHALGASSLGWPTCARTSARPDDTQLPTVTVRAICRAISGGGHVPHADIVVKVV